jgi:choline dehydrogenase
MGPESDPQAVVGSDFRVHGTQNLRVVDASVFPRIPGFFLVTAVYMVAEKASAVIARAAATADAPSAVPVPAELRRVLAHLPHPRKPHSAHALAEMRRVLDHLPHPRKAHSVPALQGHRAAQENR